MVVTSIMLRDVGDNLWFLVTKLHYFIDTNIIVAAYYRRILYDS